MLLIVFEGSSETGLLNQAKWVFEGLWVSGWEVGRLHGFKDTYTSASSGHCGNFGQEGPLMLFSSHLPVSTTSISCPLTLVSRTQLTLVWLCETSMLTDSAASITGMENYPSCFPIPSWIPLSDKYSVAMETQWTPLGAHLSQHLGPWCAATPWMEASSCGPAWFCSHPAARGSALDGPRGGVGDEGEAHRAAEIFIWL